MTSIEHNQNNLCVTLISQGFGANDSMLFSGDILDCWDRYSRLVTDILLLPKSYRILHCSSAKDVSGSILHIDDILDYVSNEYFSEAILLYLPELEVSVYNDPSSNFSLVRARREILQPYVDDWDLGFCNHMNSVGVGFGIDGRIFIETFITEVAKQLPSESQRFNRLRQCANLCN